jgi:superfamily II DNA or RNA helicase
MIKQNILFIPSKFPNFEEAFLIIEKEKKGNQTKIDYKNYELKLLREELKSSYKLLVKFDSKSINLLKNQLKSDFYRLKLSISFEDFFYKNYFQTMYDNIKAIFNYQDKNLISYHKVEGENKRWLISPCRLSETKPKIFFKLGRKKQSFDFRVFITIDNQNFNLRDFKKYQYLIEKENVYYLLEKSDYSTLELIEKELKTIKNDNEFVERIYDKIVKKYKVEEDDFFKNVIVEIKPNIEIQVTEISGNFLMFIPKWNYNGHVVEDQKKEFTVAEGTTKYTYIRNQEVEKNTIDFLQNAHPNFKGKNSFYLTFSEAKKQNWFFNFYHYSLKDNFTVVGMDLLSSFRYSQEQINTVFEVKKIVDNEIIATFKNSFGKEKIDLKSLQKSVNEGRKFILLKDNTLGVLTDEWLEKYSLILKYSHLEGDEIRFAKWILIVSEKLIEHQKSLKLFLPNAWMEKWEKWNKTSEQLYEIPKTINAQLRPYQQKGFEWLNLMSEINAGVLLADDMGLGKTLQTIAALAHVLEEKPKAKILIVCPASLVFNWKDEFEKFFPSSKLHLHHGKNRKFENFISSDSSIIICSYSTLRVDIDAFTNIIWDCVVLDESHNIKNIQSLQTQAALRLLSRRRFILNGTPIMNHVFDLFPQLSFILPQIFYSQKKFKDEFEKPISKTMSQEHLNQLRKITQAFILRRTKENVAPDLPPKMETIVWCEMEEEQKQAYEKLKEKVKNNVFSEVKNKGVNQAKLGVLQGIMKLRQMCSAPKTLEDNIIIRHPSIKIDQLLDELNSNLKDKKTIVFSQFLDTMKLIANELEKNNIKFVQFDGSTSSEKRMELVKEFQSEDSDIQVFLLSLMAGNSGINLTAANYVYLMEPWWNKAVQQQAIDRVHRIGQKQNVFAYNMICKDTIEEKIIALQKKKQFISKEVIGNDEGFVKNLSQEDIEFLFE